MEISVKLGGPDDVGAPNAGSAVASADHIRRLSAVCADLADEVVTEAAWG